MWYISRLFFFCKAKIIGICNAESKPGCALELRDEDSKRNVE